MVSTKTFRGHMFGSETGVREKKLLQNLLLNWRKRENFLSHVKNLHPLCF